ncbi:MAG: glutamate--tRNA ligase [Candidatus Omnitrophota bacterium]
MRVRFAPSPTGNLHIGGARTALFNWLYAKAKQGQFILRIEDTDQERSKKEYLDEILQSLTWLGFDWDEIYFQSKRLDTYKEYALKLVKAGKAYLEKPEAIIFKVIPQRIKMDDLIHGQIEFDASLIKDQVLIKSDGMPTYNFACVVDDATMEVSHVIRGDDHISNTPKQILIYQALGFKVPTFAHLPLILNKQGGRLSKRTGATSISEFRELGFLSKAVVNYLLCLGWSPGEDQEIIDINQASRIFNINDANKTAAIFDWDKLNWINNQYIKNASLGSLADLVIPMIRKRFPQAGSCCVHRQGIEDLIKLYQGRINTLGDFLDWADFFFLDDIKIEQGLKDKFFKIDLSKEFSMFIERLNRLEPFTVESIEKAFRDLVGELNISSRKLIHPIRVALTGKTVGPGLFDVIFHLGKRITITRLKKIIKHGG